ncbi:MAG: hypothetical protein BBJ57_01075 [Desulfobacterales bacterium PC51MH44]|nr:MAG: hypothetical protein BBJ57_01075 [Desulfobacterales bacterium PC51MH44]
MGCTVFVNIRSVAHKGAGGKAVCMTPDVCKTPAAPSPVPIPYPNIAQDSSTADGSKTVKFDGNPIMLKTSNFSTSSGDEAGNAGGGIASSKFKGKAKFVSYSFDVKVEGKNVCRHLDMMLMNGNGFNDNGTYTLRGGDIVSLSRMPNKKECQTAKKLLGDFPSRIRENYKNPKAARAKIAELIALGNDITSVDIPWADSEFPGHLKGLKKEDINEICAGIR